MMNAVAVGKALLIGIIMNSIVINRVAVGIGIWKIDVVRRRVGIGITKEVFVRLRTCFLLQLVRSVRLSRVENGTKIQDEVEDGVEKVCSACIGGYAFRPSS